MTFEEAAPVFLSTLSQLRSFTADESPVPAKDAQNYLEFKVPIIERLQNELAVYGKVLGITVDSKRMDFLGKYSASEIWDHLRDRRAYMRQLETEVITLGKIRMHDAAKQTADVDAAQRPRAAVPESIQIVDEDLRSRCLDLFAQFHQDGQHERLDTVVAEASRILEDRLRRLSAADAGLVGLALAAHAFGGDNPPLVVSAIVAEQQGVHQLFRGYFGFVRNSVHHRLVGPMAPDRTLQVVAMTDYLISIAESARRGN